MKILTDEKIPLIADLFGTEAAVIQKPGHLITADDLKDVDVLLVRTVTKVNEALLKGSAVRFVGTATSGIDHLDCDYLKQYGIAWASAKGANAEAVVNYVMGSITTLQKLNKLPKKPRVGIIGVGKIGSRLAEVLKPMATEILLNDPLRAENEIDFVSTPLEAFYSLDLISLHTPLTHHTQHPTYHLINAEFLRHLKPQSVLINTARGGVIDEAALLELTEPPTLCLDVWEHEPSINLKLMELATIATPHIAGYSQEAKWRASLMLYEPIRRCFGLSEMSASLKELLPLEQERQFVNCLYLPLKDTEVMKNALLNSDNARECFEELRRNYIPRRDNL